MSNFILNKPKTEYNYEFMVIKSREDGNYDWVANYEFAGPAYDHAKEIGGVVAHNVRVRHKEKI